MKKKNLLDSMMHFDRFNTDLYVRVVNRKNNVELKEESESSNNIYDYIILVLYFLGFVICLISLIIIYYVL